MPRGRQMALSFYPGHPFLTILSSHAGHDPSDDFTTGALKLPSRPNFQSQCVSRITPSPFDIDADRQEPPAGAAAISATIGPWPLRYSAADSASASHQWGANCGPHSIAAACQLTLAEVRPALGKFRRLMNPTEMCEALTRLGQRFRMTKGLTTLNLCNGISRIQLEGPWLNPGVHPSVAYHHTHWVAHFDGWVLCTACDPAKWIRVGDWRYFHLQVEPTSPFHVSHHYEFQQPPHL